MAAVAKFWDARRKSGGASASAFSPPLARRLLSGSGARGRRRCTTTRLVHSRPAFMPVFVLLARLVIYRNVLHRASLAIPITNLALHRHALCRLLLARLGFHAELSM
jgi:hypothetical protein